MPSLLYKKKGGSKTMANSCLGCGDTISSEERQSGSKDYCIICEVIHPSKEEQKERFLRMEKERKDWKKKMDNLFPKKKIEVKTK